ncbi:UNVERIFIED_CONTAM: hypothetical protein GTU68_064473 [Idotea baltica]|nr:hypothetical protein [Idotea baltica]
MNNHCLLINCPDQKGLIYKISKVIYEENLNIEKQSEYVDKENKHFFLRTEISGDIDNSKLISKIQNACGLEINISSLPPKKKKIVILSGKELHCAGDLFLRHYSEELNFNIQAIISNHSKIKSLADKFSLPFHYIPHKDLKRELHEEEVAKIINEYSPDLIILAKYMRVLTNNFTSQFQNRIINIHHSFLPAFIGARPYHQAFKRGVKVIGATAHFINEELDQGPIIAQDVIRVDHSKEPEQLIWAGQNIEKAVLAKAVRLYCENRIFVHRNKTIVFD